MENTMEIKAAQKECFNSRAAEWSRIRNAYERQTTIRTAKIIDAVPLEIKNQNEKSSYVLVARCSVNGFEGYIPLNELWTSLPSPRVLPQQGDTELSYINRAISYINNMTGCDNVPVVITHARYNPEASKDLKFGVIASRRRALLRDISSFYQSPDDKSNRQTPPTAVGDIVTATVVQASAGMVQLNVRGVDVIVPYYRLTNRYVEHVRDTFKPGQELLVTITDIEWPNDDDHVVHMLPDHEALEKQLAAERKGSKQYNELSDRLESDRIVRIPRLRVNARDLEARMLYEKNGDGVTRNGRYRGIITSMYMSQAPNSDGRPYIRMFLPDLELAAVSNSINYGSVVDSPSVGDVVEFRFQSVSHGSVPLIYGSVDRLLQKNKG